MLLSQRTERAIEACFDAAIATERWPSALQLLGESLGAESSTFATRNHAEDPFRMPRSDGHEDFAQLWLRNDPHAPDPHIPRASLHETSEDFVLEEHVSTEEERRTLPYYQETARPGKRDWWAAARFKVEGRPWCLSLYRSAVRGPFSVEEARYAAAAGRHLSRIIGLAEKVADAGALSGLRMLERFKCAAMVIDATGVARHLNSSAQVLLGSDFNLCQGRPAANDHASNRRLQQLLATVLRVRNGASLAPDPVVIDCGGLPWLLAEALPITAFGSDFFSSGRTILTLTDLTLSSRPDASLLMAAYNLTAAEARLAVQIVSGSGIDDAARTIGVGRETARSQLKAVFAKTNTSRQAELVNLLTRLRPSNGDQSSGVG
jgi:DNA-binding CsgD family transcriptional regulator